MTLKSFIISAIFLISSNQSILATTLTCTILSDEIDVDSPLYKKEFNIDTSTWVVTENKYFSDGTLYKKDVASTVIQNDRVLGWVYPYASEATENLPAWGSIESYVLDRESLMLMASIVAATSFSTPGRNNGAELYRCVVGGGI